MHRSNSNEDSSYRPRLPPEICGVGDYSLIKSQLWRSHFEIETTFLVAETNWPHGDSIDDFPVEVLTMRSGSVLEAAAERRTAM